MHVIQGFFQPLGWTRRPVSRTLLCLRKDSQTGFNQQQLHLLCSQSACVKALVLLLDVSREGSYQSPKCTFKQHHGGGGRHQSRIIALRVINSQWGEYWWKTLGLWDITPSFTLNKLLPTKSAVLMFQDPLLSSSALCTSLLFFVGGKRNISAFWENPPKIKKYEKKTFIWQLYISIEII